MGAKYREVVDFVKKQIENKEMLPGDKLLPEIALMEQFQLSRQTVRHALGVLEEEGYIRRKQGSGSFVNENRLTVRGNKTAVAVVTTYVDSYIFPKTIQGIEKVLTEENLTMQLAFTGNKVERERQILEDILKKDEVAGIIIEATKSALPNPNMRFYRQLQEKRIPILFINSYYREIQAPHVSIHDKNMAKKATAYLIQAGHKKIGGIFKPDDGQGHLRYAGYTEAMRRARLPIDDGNIVWMDSQDMNRPEFIKDKIKERFKDCTAVLAYNDQVAGDLIHIFSQAGRQIPEDISIISFDDSELAVMGEVLITSLSYPADELGKRAAANLLNMLDNPAFGESYEFDMGIIERESVKKITKQNKK